MTQVPIPVHAGTRPLTYWDDIEDRQREFGEDAAPGLQGQRRPALAHPGLNWSALGFEPRWVGFDTADCVAALQPSVFSEQGADEFDRFRQGAVSRGELAVVISTMGQVEVDDPAVRNIFGPPVDSIYLGPLESTISGRTLGKGAQARAADGLSDADAQLALRLLNCNPPLPWRALSLHGVIHESYNRRVHLPAQGELEPIIVTTLGEPVVAAWVSPDVVERRYVVPIETPWPVLLQWLLEYGLPEYVPGAMRRARHHLAADQSLMTHRERAARAALADLETDYAARHADLMCELEDAHTAAATVRDGLLYGTGAPLVATVRTVLEAAGITVVDLDAELGGTKNADLLCSYGGRARLVEVKSASGSASERVYQDLVRHLREWPSLPGSAPVEGGALVINHEHRNVPQERSPRPFGRPEFLAAQTEPVMSTLDLLEVWRQGDYGGVRGLLFPGLSADATAAVADDSASGSVEDAAATNGALPRKRGWLSRALDSMKPS